jgi:hypothetical protein
MPELPLLAAGMGWPLLKLQWSLDWQRLGGALVQEDRSRLTLRGGSAAEPTLILGWDRLVLARTESRDRPYVGVGITIPVPPNLRIRIEPHLTAPPPWYGRLAARRWLLVTGGGRGIAWAVAVDKSSGGDPSVQIDLAGRVAPWWALGLRAEPATGVSGITLAWYRGAWLLRTSHLIHAELGVTHRWYLAVGDVGGVR